MMKHFLAFLALILTLASCTPSASTEGTEMTLKYATLLTLDEGDSCTIATVRNPWKKESELARYVIVPSAQPLPHNVPQGTLLHTPLRRNVVTSSVHLSLLADLKALDMVAGVTDRSYIVSRSISDSLKDRPAIADFGQSMQPDVERIRAARADAVWVSPFENAGHGAMDRLGVPLIECADYMEVSPLARAEWMRFYGRLVGRAAEADSLFEAVERDYLSCKDEAEKAFEDRHRPTVVSDLRSGNTWYQPSGASTMGIFIEDAGGHNLWAERKENGSLPLSIESVMAQGQRADIWLVKYGMANDLTYAQMQRDFGPYAQFSAWKQHCIYGCNTLKVPFYEDVPFHPERLLRNLASIFSGKTGKGATYYSPLKGGSINSDDGICMLLGVYFCK